MVEFQCAIWSVLRVKLDKDYHAWQAQYSDGLRQSGQIIDIEFLNEAMAREIGARIDEEVFGDYDELAVPSAITAARYIIGATVSKPELVIA